MMNSSYDSSSNNSSMMRNRNYRPFLNMKRNTIKRTLGKSTFSSYINGSPLIDEPRSDDDSEEDEKTKQLRKREEFKDFLIKLLTESPNERKRKNKSKLKPIDRSKFTLNKTITSKARISTEPSESKSVSKYLSTREKKKLMQKLKKEKEKREKEREKKENQKIMKEIKLKQKQNKEIFRSNLNRLYGYNRKFLFYNAKLKKEKCSSLEKYHENILRVSSINISKDNLLKLFSDLKTIKINSEQTKPLPPINFPALVCHSLNESGQKKRFGYKQPNKKFSEMDEYEKEMYMIKTNSRHEKMNFNTNKFLYKMYEILPEHVVETIYAKKRKF